MKEIPLWLQCHKGSLKIIIHLLDKTKFESIVNFNINSLVEYVNAALSFITGKPIVIIPHQWKTLRFNPNERILEVQQVAGEPVKIVPDNKVKPVYGHAIDAPYT